MRRLIIWGKHQLTISIIFEPSALISGILGSDALTFVEIVVIVCHCGLDRLILTLEKNETKSHIPPSKRHRHLLCSHVTRKIASKECGNRCVQQKLQRARIRCLSFSIQSWFREKRVLLLLRNWSRMKSNWKKCWKMACFLKSLITWESLSASKACTFGAKSSRCSAWAWTLNKKVERFKQRQLDILKSWKSLNLWAKRRKKAKRRFAKKIKMAKTG